jgi:hypothetical protein
MDDIQDFFVKILCFLVLATMSNTDSAAKQN